MVFSLSIVNSILFKLSNPIYPEWRQTITHSLFSPLSKTQAFFQASFKHRISKFLELQIAFKATPWNLKETLAKSQNAIQTTMHHSCFSFWDINNLLRTVPKVHFLSKILNLLNWQFWTCLETFFNRKLMFWKLTILAILMNFCPIKSWPVW